MAESGWVGWEAVIMVYHLFDNPNYDVVMTD